MLIRQLPNDSVYPGLTGGTQYYAPGDVAGNESTTYRYTNQIGPLSAAERPLNENALRVQRNVPFTGNPNHAELADVAGDPCIPVLSVHGIGDLFVPFSMDQAHARLMAANGESNLFVDRAIREVSHCGHTQSELSGAFSALVNRIHTGQRPPGHDILNRKAVQSADFGCRFTDQTPGAQPIFSGSLCPQQPGNVVPTAPTDVHVAK